VVATGTADAVDREAGWLSTAGDGLPALLASAGGPFDEILAYYPRTPYDERRSIYVLRHRIQQRRWGAQRVAHQYPFRLILWWPILAVDGNAEGEQRAFDAAIDLLLQRLLGPLGNKTHGGRFLSVGENPSTVDVDFTDPEHTIAALNGLRVEVTYSADDPELNA
jgi:hypothetical protein